MRLSTKLLVLLALVTLISSAQAATRRMILRVETAPLAWGVSCLNEYLTTALSRNANLRILTSDPLTDDQPPFPSDRYNIDSLFDWGTEVGGRYLLVVAVEREALERRKTFSVPLLFQRWETIGVIQGELRLLDLQKRRLLVAESFEEKMSGSRQIQAEADDNRHDPSLHLVASEKVRLFQTLEQRLVNRLVEKVSRLTRGR